MRSVPTLEQVVLGQHEVSQHLDGRSWDSAKCPNTRKRGLGTVRGVPTLERRVLGGLEDVLGQCEVSKHSSRRPWDSVNCPNT